MDRTRLGRTYLESHPLPTGIEIFPGMELTTGMLVDSFRCFLIEEDVVRVQPDQLAPNASRLRGRPHLPAGMSWPQPSYLFAQLDLAMIAGFDLWTGFPGSGTAYVYFDPSRRDFEPFSTTAGTLVVSSETPAELAPEPPADALPYGGEYYRKHFLAEARELKLRPAFSMSFTENVPDAILAGLEKELGMPLCDPTDAVIGGRPVNYQGEDEAELFAPEDWDWSLGPPPIPERFLLVQDAFGEGHAHFWVDANELRRGQLSSVDVTYSGT